MMSQSQSLTNPFSASQSLIQSPTARTADRSADGLTYGDPWMTSHVAPPNMVALTVEAVVTVTAPTLGKLSIAACLIPTFRRHRIIENGNHNEARERAGSERDKSSVPHNGKYAVQHAAFVTKQGRTDNLLLLRPWCLEGIIQGIVIIDKAPIANCRSTATKRIFVFSVVVLTSTWDKLAPTSK